MAVTQPVSIYRTPFPHPHSPVKTLSALQDPRVKSPALRVVSVRAGPVSAAYESPGPTGTECALNKLALNE